MSIGLFNNQIETVNKMKNGCILCSCVGMENLELLSAIIILKTAVHENL